MGSLQFPNMGMGLRLAAFGRRSSASNYLQLILIIKKEQQEGRDQTQLIMHMFDNINLKCFYATPKNIV